MITYAIIISKLKMTGHVNGSSAVHIYLRFFVQTLTSNHFSSKCCWQTSWCLPWQNGPQAEDHFAQRCQARQQPPEAAAGLDSKVGKHHDGKENFFHHDACVVWCFKHTVKDDEHHHFQTRIISCNCLPHNWREPWNQLLLRTRGNAWSLWKGKWIITEVRRRDKPAKSCSKAVARVMIQEREEVHVRCVFIGFWRIKVGLNKKDDGKNDRLKNAPLKGASIGRLRTAIFRLQWS